MFDQKKKSKKTWFFHVFFVACSLNLANLECSQSAAVSHKDEHREALPTPEFYTRDLCFGKKRWSLRRPGPSPRNLRGWVDMQVEESINIIPFRDITSAGKSKYPWSYIAPGMGEKS